MAALANLDAVSGLLACPACHGSLVRSADGFRCNASHCDLHGEPFPTTGSWPILADLRQSVIPAALSTTASDGAPRRAGSDRLPEWVRPLWKPRNEVAAANIERLVSLTPDSPLILVVGGGTIGNGVESIYEDERIRVLAFDIYGSDVTQFIADAHQIPLADESVDAAVVQAVLEHVLDPVQVVAEIRRVLKPNGVVYAETPFLQQVHAGAHDFVRYTSSGHRYLFREFDEIAAGPVAGPGTQLQWSIDHLVRALTRSELVGRISRGLFFWLRWLDLLVPEPFAMDSASAYFFLGRPSKHTLTPAEIVRYYRGAQRRVATELDRRPV